MLSVSLPFPKLFRRNAADPETARWRALIEAARATPYYSRAARRVLLDRASLLLANESSAEIPALFAPVDLHYFFSHPREFLNESALRTEPQPLHALWEPQPRVAAIAPWFRLAAPVRVFNSLDPAELERFDPEALAASLDSLRRVATDMRAGLLRLPNLHYGLIVFTGIGWPPLTEEDRDFLWRAAGVPVWEQFRGFQGELLAGESDCRGGLHLSPPTAHLETSENGELLLTSFANLRHPVFRLATGYTAEIDTAPCACIQASRRLLDLRALSLALAAAAE